MWLKIIAVLLLLVTQAHAQCAGSEQSDSETLVDTYLNRDLLSVTDIQVTCPGSLSAGDCGLLDTFIDELLALGADGQCYLSAYDYFESERSDPSINIQCSFEDVVELCPDATTLTIAVDGGYGDWSSWSCDCGDTATRTRSCDSPQPINDGLTCSEQSLGDAEQTQSCECDDSDENSANAVRLCSVWILCLMGLIRGII